MKSFQHSHLQSSLIQLKDEEWIRRQRIAGKAVSESLMTLQKEVQSGTDKTLIELSNLAEQIILDHNCSPTFKGYKGFPAAVCISVNRQLVHGIPTDYRLVDGDVVSFDLGATYENAITDSAITCGFGSISKQHQELIEATAEALNQGILAAVRSKRLGAVGNAIYRYARNKNFSVVTNYGGHGLEYGRPHAAPFVHNRAEPTDGPTLVPGLTIAIEPMLVVGSSAATHTQQDGWTVNSDNISAHTEHTVFFHSDHLEIMTHRTDDRLSRIIAYEKN